MQRLILGFALVALGGASPLFSQTTKITYRRVFEWGSLDMRANGSVLRLSIRPLSLARSATESQGIPKTPGVRIIPQPGPHDPASYMVWIIIPPGSSLRVQSVESHVRPFADNRLLTTTGYFQLTDSSSLTPIRSLVSINQVNLTKTPVVLEAYDVLRGVRLARVRVYPYIKNGETAATVDSVEVSFSIQNGSGFVRTKAGKLDRVAFDVLSEIAVNFDPAAVYSIEMPEWPDSTGTWISYGVDYLKLAIPRDAVYRLYGTDLSASIPNLSSVNTQEFRLFNRGQEIPIRIEDGADGIMDAGDYIEFVGFKNYGDSSYRRIPVGQQENPLFMNRYTDTSFYWLTWQGPAGKRVQVDSSFAPVIDTLRWFTEMVHLEQDNSLQFVGTNQLLHQDPDWLPGDIWTWGFLDANQSFDVSFAAKNVSSEFTTARLAARYSSWAAQPLPGPVHRVTLHLNGSGALATDSLSAYQQGLTQTQFGASLLSNGSNTLQLRSLPTASSVNRLIVDWFDVEYPRTLLVDADTMVFRFRDLSSRSYRGIQISGFSTPNAVVYKTSGQVKRIVPSVSGSGPYTLDFADTTGNGDQYIVSTESVVSRPLIIGRKQFRNLRDPQRSADYLLVTSRGFSSVASQYALFIQSTYGVTTAVAEVEDIYDEFGFGYPMPESIREFLKSTTVLWQTAPSYVFLVGDANYDFKNVTPVPDESRREKNIVPALGCPVSDPLLVTFGGTPFPQMYIGRIAASSQSEFQQYFSKVQAYVQAGNDDWNKRYILFSGGDPNSFGEIEAFKNVHVQIANAYVQPSPTGGLATLFYKTTTPPSDYGPYTREQVDEILFNGAVFIDYIGHSGTQTWDNGIGDPSQLQNGRQRSPLMLDFGCSTGKFAEPSIKAFGELFTLGQNASAIAYVGNSALGFSSVAVTLPQEFFRKVLADSTYEIGRAHLLAKVRRATTYGTPTDPLNRVMLLTNTLIGDPIIRLPIPQKPNLGIKQADVQLATATPTDDDDGVDVKIAYENTGKVLVDSFSVRVRSDYSQVQRDTLVKRKVPSFRDTVSVRYPIKDRPGQHVLTIRLNPDQFPDEIDFSNNEAAYQVLVASNALKPLTPLSAYEAPTKELTLLNPQRELPGSLPLVILETDTAASFSSPFQFQQQLQGIRTRFALTNLQFDRRYYWRAGIQNANRPPAQGSIFFSSQGAHRWHPADSASWSLSTLSGAVFIPGSGVRLGDRLITVRGTSSGFDEGRLGAIEIEGINVVGNSFDRGHHVAVLDSADLGIRAIRSFDTFGSADQAESLQVFLESVQTGDIVAEVISDEGSFNLTTPVKNAIKSIGSALIDSVAFRDSWAIIGRKGSGAGTVPEMFSRRFSGRAIVETTFVRRIVSGLVTSPVIGPAGAWSSVTVQAIVPAGSSMLLDVIGLRSDGQRDTLMRDQPAGSFSLASVPPKTYPSIQLVGKLTASATGNTPVMSDWSVSFVPAAELAVNYQTVTLSQDTLLEGESAQVDMSVNNVGYVPADSVGVSVQALTQSGLVQLGSFLIPRIGPDSAATLTTTFSTANRRGSNVVLVNVDSAQRVIETYRSNNFFSAPLYVLTDTVAPTFDITFDGNRILDGDYVGTDPDIRIGIRDNSPLPMTNPASVILRLDNRRITLGSTPDSLFEAGSGSEKAAVTFKPRLTKGNHLLSIQVQDASGNFSDTTARETRFRVETESRLLNVVNIPNPMSRETHFTFNLTGAELPDEVTLKIFAVSGRLIHEIRIPRSQLRLGFNAVPWSGRDRDGDVLANGVYFYKLAMTVNGSLTEVIEKLAIVR